MASLLNTRRHSQRLRRGRYINFRRILTTAILLPALALTQDDDDPTSSAEKVSEPFVDQVTGLQMERFFGARTSFGFALALPQAAPAASATASSFIGQLSFQLVNGEDWGARGLTGDMEGNLFLAATDEDNPPEVSSDFRVRPIPDGVFVNATSLLYTFLCENCLDTTLGFGPEDVNGNAVMGWALSEQPPIGDAADPGAQLGFHERGFGPFTARLRQAQTRGFATAAATALEPVQESGNAVSALPGAFEEGSDGKDSGDEGGDDDSRDENSDGEDARTVIDNGNGAGGGVGDSAGGDVEGGFSSDDTGDYLDDDN